MKTIYRVGPGRFINLDSHVQPWWQTLHFYLRPRPHAGAFLASFVFRWLQRLLFPPLNDDQDDLTNDELHGDWDLREIEHQYSVQHCERCWRQRAVEPPRAEQEP